MNVGLETNYIQNSTVSVLHIEELRDKTISEIRDKILENRNSIQQMQNQKNKLIKIKKDEQNYYRSGLFPQITQVFHRVTNNLFSPIEKLDEKILQCESEEEHAQANLKLLILQMRMKELARINDWWKENYSFISKRIPNSQIKEFKDRAFKELSLALDESEASFLEKAEKLVYQLDFAA